MSAYLSDHVTERPYVSGGEIAPCRFALASLEMCELNLRTILSCL